MTHKYVLLAVLIAVLALALRLPGLGEFMTVDEGTWMERSASFWHKLFREGDIAGTFITTHPGATTMWLAGAGIVWQEARLGVDLDDTNMLHFRKVATFPIAFTSACLIGLIVWLLAILAGRAVAVATGVLLAADPYLVGMSQVVHVDLLLSLLMMAALLFFLLSLKGRSIKGFVLTGILVGLSLAEKLPLALWLLPMFAAILLFDRYGRQVGLSHLAKGRSPLGQASLRREAAASIRPSRIGNTVREKAEPITKPLAKQPRADTQSPALPGFVAASAEVLQVKLDWFKIGKIMLVVWLTAFITLAVVWPALLTKADLQLGYVSRDTKAAIVDEHVALTAADEPITPSSFYLRTWLARSTPFTLFFVLLGVAISFAQWRSNKAMSLSWWWLLYAVGFLLVITLVAKKADRYALPALVGLQLVAGSSMAATAGYLRTRLPKAWNWIYPSAVGAVLLLIIALPLLWTPHAIAYNNKLFDVRPMSQQGWGEGLEEAASWLNEHALQERLVVASWYRDVMSTYFQGKTFRLSSRTDYRVSYLVTYRNMGGRAADTIASNVLDELKGEEPVHTVYIQGVPYVWIYETDHVGSFLKHIGELVGNMEVGQLVSPQTDNWQRIDIGFATFSSRDNTEDIILNIRESVDSRYNLRTVRVNASEIIDNEWHTFTFKPITKSAEKEFYVAITSPTSTAGNAVTVRYVDEDVLPGQMVLRRGRGEANEDDNFKPGDIAYRLPEL